MSPASQAPLLKTGMFSQGSQNLALGLAMTAASQLVSTNYLPRNALKIRKAVCIRFALPTESPHVDLIPLRQVHYPQLPLEFENR